MKKDSPDTLQKAETILKDYTGNSNEDKYPFVECATFADYLKDNGGAFQTEWHFIDSPYLDEGGNISDYDFTFDKHNITEAMSAIQQFITHSSGYRNSYEYQQIMQYLAGIKREKGSDDEKEALSIALRLIIHYVGDIHQPLHATARVDKEYEKGD